MELNNRENIQRLCVVFCTFKVFFLRCVEQLELNFYPGWKPKTDFVKARALNG